MATVAKQVEQLKEQMALKLKTDRYRIARTKNFEDIIRKKGWIPETGRDSEGRVVEVGSLKNLGMLLRGEFASFYIHADDMKALKGLPLVEANKRVRAGEQERKEYHVITDIFHAVRLFQHVRTGYVKEYVNRKVINFLDGLNARAAATTSNIQEEAKKIAEEAESVIKMLSGRVRTGSKLVALKELEAARDALLKASDAQTVFSAMSQMTAACTKLVASRNRYAIWRAEEIRERGTMASMKECALRVKRDNEIVRLLKDWADICGKADQTRNMIRKSWERDRGLRKIAHPERLKPSYLDGIIHELDSKEIGKRGQRFFASASENFFNGKKRKALADLKRLYFHVSYNKPDYVAEQLEKTGDGYLKGVAAAIRKGADAFYSGNLFGAAECFAKALELMPK